MVAHEPATRARQVEFREGGAIPAKQLRHLAAALGHPAAAVEPAQLLDSMLVVSAWDGARLVGLARLVGDGRALVVLQHVGVHPAYRWRGIGGALVARCLARCGAAEVFVLLGGPAEAAFYARFGFTAPVRALARPAPRPGGGAPVASLARTTRRARLFPVGR